MNKFVFTFILLIFNSCIWAQPTFKAGWNTYKIGTLTREYTYNLINNDTGNLHLTDSLMVYTSPDSLVTLTVHKPFRQNDIYTTVCYYNIKKQLLKKEEYTNGNLQEVNQWRYDKKFRKIYHLEDNKTNGNTYKTTYEYAPPNKKNGDHIVKECSFYNGRIEFYTNAYYDKHNVKYKEVRLNDNDKEVVHIESYSYGKYGKLKERSVYFPAWKVTKKFEEKGADEPPTCFRYLPVGTAAKVHLNYRVPYMKWVLGHYHALLHDSCKQFEYIFKNYTNCDIVLSSTDNDKIRKVVFHYFQRY